MSDHPDPNLEEQLKRLLRESLQELRDQPRVDPSSTVAMQIELAIEKATRPILERLVTIEQVVKNSQTYEADRSSNRKFMAGLICSIIMSLIGAMLSVINMLVSHSTPAGH